MAIRYLPLAVLGTFFCARLLAAAQDADLVVTGKQVYARAKAH